MVDCGGGANQVEDGIDDTLDSDAFVKETATYRFWQVIKDGELVAIPILCGA